MIINSLQFAQIKWLCKPDPLDPDYRSLLTGLRYLELVEQFIARVIFCLELLLSSVHSVDCLLRFHSVNLLLLPAEILYLFNPCRDHLKEHKNKVHKGCRNHGSNHNPPCCFSLVRVEGRSIRQENEQMAHPIHMQFVYQL